LDKSYTILVVPDRDAKVKKIRVEHRTLVRVAVAATAVLLAVVGMAAHYFTVVGKVAENALLRDENLVLQNRWKEAEQKFGHINDELDRVRRLNANLRHITQLNDPDRALAIGPVGSSRGQGGGNGLGQGVTRIFDGRAISFAGGTAIYLTAGTGNAPLSLFRVNP
jgi:hypothetical protein